ncbi:MAG TPA: metal-sensitive transcriptional regulator [Meiothermus sp.]|jgi:DNA-binding FrmR family transcriptional regulator|nr:metal-sensitive transcriptional regulator [Meiothermus sp.]
MTETAEKQKVLNRLRRLEGQVRGLSKMVEEDRPCTEILTLLSGIRGALDGIGELVLENFLEECRSSGQQDPKTVLEAVRLLR